MYRIFATGVLPSNHDILLKIQPGSIIAYSDTASSFYPSRDTLELLLL